MLRAGNCHAAKLFASDFPFSCMQSLQSAASGRMFTISQQCPRVSKWSLSRLRWALFLFLCLFISFIFFKIRGSYFLPKRHAGCRILWLSDVQSDGHLRIPLQFGSQYRSVDKAELLVITNAGAWMAVGNNATGRQEWATPACGDFIRNEYRDFECKEEIVAS